MEEEKTKYLRIMHIMRMRDDRWKNESKSTSKHFYVRNEY